MPPFLHRRRSKSPAKPRSSQDSGDRPASANSSSSAKTDIKRANSNAGKGTLDIASRLSDERGRQPRVALPQVRELLDQSRPRASGNAFTKRVSGESAELSVVSDC
jgi:hypothetical protein